MTQVITKREVKEVLNEMLGILQEGRMTEGQEVYFNDDVVTQEGNNPPLTGKQNAIERLNDFRNSIGVAEFISYKVGDVAVEGSTSFYDAVLTLKLNNGQTISLEQVVKTVWNDQGKIAFERYYHG
jgi:hypothetical protein